ncbi:MAG: polysaccharide export protein, partial [Planctomycetes bacterium]|nr:polysaccharide export protein [Planctomycetota bacterium]
MWLIIMCMIGSAMCWSAEPSYPPQDDAETQQVEAIVHGGGMSVRAGPSIQGEVGIGGGTAMPAWAAKSLPNQEVTLLLPFGANMFQGYFTNTRPSGLGARYVIMPGDGIAVKVWGTRSFEGTQVVDHQGNIFIPEVGPITVAGLAHRQLNEVVRRRLRESYPTGVDVYTNLLSAQPLSVYVSGFVNKPGYYAGGPADSVLSFIDRAGGIVNQRGSYRCIKIMRRNRQVAVLDLYMFLLSGILPEFRLEENDVILVQERGPSVAVLGDIRQQARYEFPPSQLISPGISSFSGRFSGAELMLMASPVESVSHVLVSGIRESGPFNLYLTKEDFSGFMLADNDVVEFVTDRQSDGILV